MLGAHKFDNSVRGRFCFNPFSKPQHGNWRKSSKLTVVTNDLRIKLKAIGSTSPSTFDKICGSCRIRVHLLFKNVQQFGCSRDNPIPEESLQKVLSTENAIFSRDDSIVENDDNESPSTESVVGDMHERLNSILDQLQVEKLTVKQYRSKALRHDTFVRATVSLKKLLQIETDVYFDETHLPVIQEQLQCYKSASKSNQFRILTLFSSTWSRQKMLDEFGCSSYKPKLFMRVH